MKISDEDLMLMVADYIWRPPSIEDEPRTLLTCWSVYRIDSDFDGNGPSVHFVGTANGASGRVCSPVQSFDPESMCGLTRSGRIYELVGPPGKSTDSSMVFKYWLANNEVTEYTEITNEYVKDTGS